LRIKIEESRAEEHSGTRKEGTNAGWRRRGRRGTGQMQGERQRGGEETLN
jgi:hypothetical protein